MWRARLGRVELPAKIIQGVVHQRDARIAALLRAPVDEAVFADIEIPRSGTAAPLVRFAARNIMLELIEACIRALSEIHHLFEDLLLFIAQRLELTIPVVQHADSARESELQGAPGHFQRIFRKSYAAAQHGIDVHLKFGVFGEQH